MGFEIENKIACVTGANRGIGRATLETFLRHGAKKIYAGVRSLDKADSLVQAHGNRVVPIRIDYSEPESIRAAAETASDTDVVVSCASILLGAPVLAEDVIERFIVETEVNVHGLLRMARAFGPVLKNNGGGAFVQLNSVASLRNFPEFASYPASKAAAYSFTQALRTAFAEQNTLVLSVHPGPVDTNMAREAGLEDRDPVEVVSEGMVQALRRGEFHLFPDKLAKDFEAAYNSFSKKVIEN